MITTQSKKNADIYWEAFDDLDIGVDEIVRTPGQFMGQDVAANVRLLGEVLLGNGHTLKEAEGFMAAPIFDRARKSLETADTNLKSAQKNKNDILKDEFYKIAFNRLFDAVRHAVMVFLNMGNSRWGQLRKALPEPYSYEGNYPKDDTDGVYTKWREEVEQFIQNLESKE